MSGTGSTTAPHDSGLSQELLNEELGAIRVTKPSVGASTTAATESGLSQELLNQELAAIHGK